MSELIKAKSENKFGRPIAISITVGDFSFAEGFEDHFNLMGAFNLWSDKKAESNYDIDAVKTSLESLNINDFAGPFISAEDKSPVRIVSTRKIALNFTNLAVLVIKDKTALNQHDEALNMLQWAQRANKTIIKGTFCEKKKVYRRLPTAGYCEKCKKPFDKSTGCPVCTKT